MTMVIENSSEECDADAKIDYVCENRTSPFKKKNLKFVSLYAPDGKAMTDVIEMLPGRHPCECLAQKHTLINNCIECGRIVCQQEGAGPCMFCGNLVCTPEDQEILSRESKKSKKLLDKLLNQLPENEIEEKQNEDLDKAIAHKNRLLEYEKNSTRRTKVFDDEADYFAADSRWLSNQQREALETRDAELREKRFASRRDKKVTIDFAGRQLADVKQEERHNFMYDENDHVVQSVMYGDSSTSPRSDNQELSSSIVDPRIKVEKPVFTGGTQSEQMRKMTQENGTKSSRWYKDSLKIQDQALQEISDSGLCLSMHQPWASLLIAGIKTVEGRSWYSGHRGRLWIASTAKSVEKDVIEHLEGQYQSLYPGKKLNFPTSYASGVLLGCVNVIDCLSQGEYIANNPDAVEESDSEFLFICEDSKELLLKLPMKGQHKIYKLDNTVHTAAKKSLKFS